MLLNIKTFITLLKRSPEEGRFQGWYSGSPKPFKSFLLTHHQWVGFFLQDYILMFTRLLSFLYIALCNHIQWQKNGSFSSCILFHQGRKFILEVSRYFLHLPRAQIKLGACSLAEGNLKSICHFQYILWKCICVYCWRDNHCVCHRNTMKSRSSFQKLCVRWGRKKSCNITISVWQLPGHTNGLQVNNPF